MALGVGINEWKLPLFESDAYLYQNKPSNSNIIFEPHEVKVGGLIT